MYVRIAQTAFSPEDNSLSAKKFILLLLYILSGTLRIIFLRFS